MHILVTGGYGFIGHHVVKSLREQKHKITIIDDLRFGTSDELVKVRRSNPAGFGDWWSNDCTKVMIDDVDVIVHLACHPNQASFAKDGVDAWHNTVGSTLHLLTKYPHAKFVYISSSMVYGNWIETVREDNKLRPMNDYGKAKLVCEQLVQDIAKSWVIIRPTAVYGINDNPNRVVSKWINAAKNNEPIMVDDPLAKLDFTYVDDIVQPIVTAATTEVDKIIANASYGQAVRLYDAAKIIVEETKSNSEIISGRDLPDDMPRRGAMDNSVAIKFLNHVPKWDFRSGVRSLI